MVFRQWKIVLVILFNFISVIQNSAVAGSDIVLSDITAWNYINGGDAGHFHYTEPVTGLFESAPTGIIFRTNMYRGGGEIISAPHENLWVTVD